MSLSCGRQLPLGGVSFRAIRIQHRLQAGFLQSKEGLPTKLRSTPMPQIQCSYCGLPFTVKKVEPGRLVFCCSGCALASRLPTRDASGAFPITPALVVALGSGFAFFNEVLFWGLAAALAHDKRAAQALLLARVSAGLGVLVWGLLAGGMWRAAVRRWTDAVVAGMTLIVLVGALFPKLSAGCVLTANGALGLWWLRGWGKQKFARNTSVTV